MSIEQKHNCLSKQTNLWLLNAINPFADTEPCRTQLKASEVPDLLKAAELHGVLPIVLKAINSSSDVSSQNLFTSCPSGEIHQANVAIENARKIQMHQTAFEMLLNHHRKKICNALLEEGIATAVVKGPVFAHRLYKVPSWRTFTDIDILISEKDRKTAHSIFRKQGFVLVQQEYREGEEYFEDKWILDENSNVMIELHCNLVHNPRFRQNCSITKEDVESAGGGDCVSPTALLFVAASHGAISHQFDRLQHVLDVALAASGRSGAINTCILREVCIKSGVLTAVYTAVYLAGKMFSHRGLLSLANELRPSLSGRLSSQLITPDMVLSARSTSRSFMSWRRKAFRQFVQVTELRPT